MNASTPSVKLATALGGASLIALALPSPTGDSGQLIAVGHTACDHYGTAYMASDMFELMGAFGINNSQAAGLMMAGMRAYCPGKLGGLPNG